MDGTSKARADRRREEKNGETGEHKKKRQWIVTRLQLSHACSSSSTHSCPCATKARHGMAKHSFIFNSFYYYSFIHSSFKRTQRLNRRCTVALWACVVATFSLNSTTNPPSTDSVHSSGPTLISSNSDHTPATASLAASESTMQKIASNPPAKKERERAHSLEQ